MAGLLVGIFGTILFFGLVRAAVWRRRWYARHGAYGWHGAYAWHAGHGCHGGYGRRGRGGPHGLGDERFARAAGEVVKRRLRIDEEQEPVVDHALRDLRAALAELAKELGDTRAAVAEAFRGESVDEAALAAAFARQDDAVGRARREAVSALKQVHAVLEPDQRERAAELLGKAGARWV